MAKSKSFESSFDRARDKLAQHIHSNFSATNVDIRDWQQFRGVASEILSGFPSITADLMPAEEGSSAEDLLRELQRSRLALTRFRDLFFKPYKGSPGFENTPDDVLEIDAIEGGYGEELSDEIRRIFNDYDGASKTD